jgi:hypothetical protein
MCAYGLVIKKSSSVYVGYVEKDVRLDEGNMLAMLARQDVTAIWLSF